MVTIDEIYVQFFLWEKMSFDDFFIAKKIFLLFLQGFSAADEFNRMKYEGNLNFSFLHSIQLTSICVLDNCRLQSVVR